jgi:RND family efflux transporter MFP subunit
VEQHENELLAEINQLRRKVAEQERLIAFGPHGGHSAGHANSKPSAGLLVVLGLLAAGTFVGLFFYGYLPQSKRQAELVQNAKTEGTTVLEVTASKVVKASGTSQLVLPGNIQAVAEAPILARATGYLKKRYVDIGDHVKEGQLVAEIDAPELTQQLQQAKASVEQASALLEQSNAALQQGRANEQLAKTTAQRYANLVQRGAVAKQDNDNFQAQWEAQRANVLALEKAVMAAKSNIAVATANVSRLNEVDMHRMVTAPFAGVITLRNVDVGALVNEGSTLLYRVAQTNRVRTYVNVPQSESAGMKLGVKATLSISELPSKKFEGVITHTSDSLDPSSRTLLVEIQLDNQAGLLKPGMYAQVAFKMSRKEPPLLIKADTLLIRADGPQVAKILPDQTIHFQKITVGRDFGETIEILAGLEEGDMVVANPGDWVQEKVKVKPVEVKEAGAGRGRG